jgi:hypothetical protein
VSVLLDHLVVAAASLQQGVDWCEATLGVTPGPGGQHPLMGTHNRLLKIASAAFPLAYLEIIAIDPAAPAPGRARWFGLDEPALQARVQRSPQLVHLVARSTQLDMHRYGLIHVGQQPGEPISASRDIPASGELPARRLAWQILVRPDGSTGCGGALPTLIQWQGSHPAETMADSSVVLHSLVLHGLPLRTQDVLRLRGVAMHAGPGAAITATLHTPRGDVVLQTATAA